MTQMTMMYADRLRKMFQGIDLSVEDLYLLDRFQIGCLPDRVPQREFAAVLRASPSIERFLMTKYPPIADFIEDLFTRFGPAANQQELDEYSDRLVWEIADQFVYIKRPDMYDERVDLGWNFEEVLSIVPLEHKLVIDAGAGTGRVAFAAAQTAGLVFAVEPVTSLRQFIRKKAAETGVTNLFVIDGFLHAIPLPAGFADVLITSNAIGWQLDDELSEIERVVKAGGYAIHLFSHADDNEQAAPLHSLLTSRHYVCSRYKGKDGWKGKYWKQIESREHGLSTPGTTEPDERNP
ncbi:MAG: class I SAM-dependent methyltransferase [bacterium]|nr:class I SAM-dependent methyltransferase [bacterium]